MTIINAPRYQTIKKVVMQPHGTVPEVTLDLWEQLASELISFIGDSGFQSLYARSVYLANMTFPWLELNHPIRHNGSRFAGLKMSLEKRNAAEATEASIALLVTFIDILASLIGEHLTAGILRAAWGQDALNQT